MFLTADKVGYGFGDVLGKSAAVELYPLLHLLMGTFRSKVAGHGNGAALQRVFHAGVEIGAGCVRWSNSF